MADRIGVAARCHDTPLLLVLTGDLFECGLEQLMTKAKNETVTSVSPKPARRAYQSPKLTEYGDVRHLTQGGTAGLDEAGNSNMNFMV